MSIHVLCGCCCSVSVLCFPSKACLCSLCFSGYFAPLCSCGLDVEKPYTTLTAFTCESWTLFYCCHAWSFLFPKEVMQILNKGFRVLYAMMAPASRTTNQIDPVVLHGLLESTISWLLCLAWIKCSKLWLLHFPLCISSIELTRVIPDFKFCFVQVISYLCSLLVGLSWGFISWSETCLDIYVITHLSQTKILLLSEGRTNSSN